MAENLQLARLRCEHLVNPLGIDIPTPRLSWELASERRGARQAAYRNTAAASESALLDGAALVWDSGRIESDQSIHVPYDGPTLASGQRVYWRVAIWDDAG